MPWFKRAIGAVFSWFVAVLWALIAANWITAVPIVVAVLLTVNAVFASLHYRRTVPAFIAFVALCALLPLGMAAGGGV